MDVLKTVAGAFKGKAIFVHVPITEKRVYEFFGITEDQVPSLVLADMGSETGLYFYFLLHHFTFYHYFHCYHYFRLFFSFLISPPSPFFFQA